MSIIKVSKFSLTMPVDKNSLTQIKTTIVAQSNANKFTRAPYNLWTFNLVKIYWKLLDQKSTLIHAIYLCCMRRECVHFHFAHRRGLPSDAFQPNLTLSVSHLLSRSATFAWHISHIRMICGRARARTHDHLIPFSNYTHLPAACDSFSCARAYKLVFKSIPQKWHVRAKLANILPLNWGYRQVLPIMLDTLRLRLHHKRQRVPRAANPCARIKSEVRERGTPTAHWVYMHFGVCVRACYLICSRTRRNVVGHLRVASGLNHIFIAGGRSFNRRCCCCRTPSAFSIIVIILYSAGYSCKALFTNPCKSICIYAAGCVGDFPRVRIFIRNRIILYFSASRSLPGVKFCNLLLIYFCAICIWCSCSLQSVVIRSAIVQQCVR